MPKSDAFRKVSVKEPVKREIAIIAGAEGRKEYEIVADALKLYKAVVTGGKAKNPGTVQDVPVSRVIGAQ